MPPDAALPPGFRADHAADPLATATERAAAGADPGTVFHGDLGDRCQLAVVLAPDHPIDDATALALGAGALRDALASLAPVGVPIAIAAGHVVLNEGVAATVRVRSAADWLVLAIDVAIDLRRPDPGLDPCHTCLAEEGFAASAAEVMAAFCRHLLVGIDAWTEGVARRVAA